jgi:chromosome partitioning protein
MRPTLPQIVPTPGDAGAAKPLSAHKDGRRFTPAAKEYAPVAIVMLINLKGGVAKTTSAVAIAEGLASAGHRTLLIDADHQCMAGELLLGEERQLRCERTKRNLHDLLGAMLDDEFSPDQFEGSITRKASNIGGGLPRLAVLPCSIRIDDFSTNMARARRGHSSNDEFLRLLAKRRVQLRKWAEANFDFTLIDCPPSIALQVRFLLSVADSYIVPSIPDRLSVRGSLFLLDRIRSHGFKIAGLGTLWSLYRTQNALHRRIVEAAGRDQEVLKRLPKPFSTVIPNAAKIAEATEPGGKPATFRQKYTPEFAKLFEALCAEIVQRAEWQRAQQPELVGA